MGAMFTLGVYVGRGNPPYRFDIQNIELELARLKASVLETEKKALEQRMRSGEVDFQQHLKAPDDDLLYNPTARPLTLPEDVLAARPQAQPDPAQKPAPSAAPQAARAPEPTAPAPEGGQFGGQTLEAAAQQADQEPPGRILAVPGGTWAVQVAASRDEADARRIRSRYERWGFPAFISSGQTQDGAQWHRVRLGPVVSQEDAQNLRTRVMDRQPEAFLVRLTETFGQ
ncbi:MAG: SPOR domain-containing protein, partial [Desulfatibacillaceae bacterium]|nr:SPOR domain-containing protein [Desulfatibacillaceae bacterium]